ncbi:hypothetical protein [Leclercia adecarboxylata]|nr:hypothetical protein [Leclercia adecarboxylata]
MLKTRLLPDNSTALELAVAAVAATMADPALLQIVGGDKLIIPFC